MTITRRLQSEISAPDTDAVARLAADLRNCSDGQRRIVAEWMLENGWTEPLDPVVEEPSLKGCICNTTSRFGWNHVTYCPWRKGLSGDGR